MSKYIEISEEKLRELVALKLNTEQIAKEFNVEASLIRKRCRKWGIKIIAPRKKFSDESRAKMSRLKKAWCAANPEKHSWRRHDKFKSVPCEKLKDWLKSKNIEFAHEFLPLEHLGRYYSIDVAFPDKMIGIEVNGNQHYNPDGTLKPYYQKRHDEIEAAGWKLYELHFSICYHIDKIESIIPTLINSPTKTSFDYKIYFRKKIVKPKKSEMDPLWRTRPRKYARRVERPSKEILEKMIWEISVTAIGAKYGISGNAVERWIKEYGIKSKPPRGYWKRIQSGQTHEEALIPAKKRQSRARHILNDSFLEQIKTLLEEGLNHSQIGAKIGFHRQVVGQFCKKYNLVKSRK